MHFASAINALAHRMPGLRFHPDGAARLERKLDFSLETRERLLSGEILPEAQRHCAAGFNPLGEARELYLVGERDDALWLHFIATMFGWDRPDSADRFLRSLGAGERASWAYVRDHAAEALARVTGESSALMKEAPFGNHRKYETHRGDRSSARVVGSFMTWARPAPAARVDRTIAGASTPERAFDCLYHAFDVYRFGRTARYDFVRLLASVDRRLRPGSCFLRGASGPRRAAALLFLGRSWARDSEVASLEEGLRELAGACGIDLTVVEDAICQWQKAIPSSDRRPREAQLTLELKAGLAQ